MTKIEFFPTLVLNDSLFELKVTDLPPVPLSFVKVNFGLFFRAFRGMLSNDITPSP